jgi:hypothetical protein
MLIEVNDQDRVAAPDQARVRMTGFWSLFGNKALRADPLVLALDAIDHLAVFDTRRLGRARVATVATSDRLFHRVAFGAFRGSFAPFISGLKKPLSVLAWRLHAPVSAAMAGSGPRSSGVIGEHWPR